MARHAPPRTLAALDRAVAKADRLLSNLRDDTLMRPFRSRSLDFEAVQAKLNDARAHIEAARVATKVATKMASAPQPDDDAASALRQADALLHEVVALLIAYQDRGY
jgi:hypothetical protein